MSDNIPSTSAPVHKKRRRCEKLRLPTPPPDPHEPASDRDEFLAYLDALQKSNHPAFSRSTSTFSPVVATEDAFDHLEKLYKLMEQMLELREQNAKLHRRVRDLEHFNNLEKMHKQLDVTSVQGNCPELDKDTAFAETILESILSDSKGPKLKSASSRLRQSISRRQRNRSGSVSAPEKPLESTGEPKSDRRASTCVDNRANKPSKVSKWTKVKAAFKWEKASPTVSDAKSQDSGIGGMVPVNLEVARYLRVPSSSEDAGHSPADSGAAEISTPGSLSTASSNEDFHRTGDLRSPCEDLRSSDDEHSYIPHSKDGSQKSKSHHHHKTPWAKMKDIIHTRNSLKKKHRLSNQSDDIQIDVELCSDNEDNVFEDEVKSKPQLESLQLTPPHHIYQRVDSNEVPADIVARYQQVVAEDGTVLEDPKKVSKWTRVKKAFLTPNELNQERGSVKTEDDSIQAEIHKNYKQLQKKLSLEFQEKLSEWERMKQNSPGISSPSSSCGFVEENRDPAFIKKMEEWQKIKSQPTKSSVQMTREEHLPPEFRKKLQEWEKIRKSSGKECSSQKRKLLGEVPRWKSLSGNHNSPVHTNSPVFEYPPITEDFKKKLDEWKQIKSGATTPALEEKPKDTSKTASPKLIRKNSSPKHSKKHKEPHDKELQWFEKELGKIEKEKQRLERERQKFLEREERLSKLRSSVVGSNKKEVLIHTPSGFYRFEGISRKFTQKLYEWEKAQGIGPESSTFALLNSSVLQDTKPYSKHSSTANTPSLIRSKSADSIAISALNLTCPLISHQPSSLSLNDVDDLEKECMADSKSSSMQYMNSEHFGLDEPEALIVEVEDVEEETAAPLHTFAQKTQQPVYLTEGETIAAPKVRRSESTRAQRNYNLIEEIFKMLDHLTENELEIQKLQDILTDGNQTKRNNSDILKLKMYDEAQKAITIRLSEKIALLQEANSNVFTSILKDEPGYSVKSVFETLESVQDLSSVVFQLTEKLDVEINNRNVYDAFREAGARSLTPVIEIVKETRGKVLELRRRLSYICAASDLTAPGKKQFSYKKRVIQKTTSLDSKEARKDDVNEMLRTGSEKVPKDGRLYIKAETSNVVHNQGAIKKKIRYRQKALLNRSLPDTDDEEENVEQKRNTHKKLTRTRSISESSAAKIEPSQNEEIIVDESIIKKVVVPTETNFVNLENFVERPVESPVTVFVKTTRKLFTPIVESGLSNKAKDDVMSVSTISNKSEESPQICVEDCSEKKEDKPHSDATTTSTDNTSEKSLVTHLPPLPASPTPQRKIMKDISPSIRLMLANYNKKLSEQETPTCKSGGSSGSASPVAWRSPAAERRVKAQTEKYQESLNKLSPIIGGRREVQKSASVGFLSSGNKQITVPKRDLIQQEDRNISKSSSATVLLRNPQPEDKLQERKASSLKLSPASVPKHSPDIRLKKLQKAKEDFLKSTPTRVQEAESIKFPTRNRLSQISVDSESSYDSACAGALIKSASAGMINIEVEAYRQFDPEVHGGGYVSLPRSIPKPKEGLLSGKFAFSSIASKFRKVKMRKGKDKDKLNVVSALCRQSLVVDINPSLKKPNEESRDISSEDASSASSSRTGSWIRKPKLFKK